MDDIARDADMEAQATPVDPGRVRLKGPVSEFAVEESFDEASRLRDGAVARLPRVLPLGAPEEESDDDLMRAPAVDAGGDADDAGDEERADVHDTAADEAEGMSEPDDPQEREPAAAPADEPSAAVPVTDPDQLVRVVFGLLLTNREGLTPLRLAQVCDTTQEAVRAALDTLRAELAAGHAPLELAQSGESYKLWTTPDVFPYLEKLRGIKKNERLSPAALETLAVIAYRQPVFRAEIEAIRGVKVGPMLRTLLDAKLIKVVGRADVPGRPLQYGTTQQFLERFGLSSLADLPSVKEFKGLSG